MMQFVKKPKEGKELFMKKKCGRKRLKLKLRFALTFVLMIEFNRILLADTMLCLQLVAA